MATSEVQTVNSSADKAKLAAAVLLLVAGFVGYYLLAGQGSLVRVGVLLGAIVVGTGLVLDKLLDMPNYLDDVQNLYCNAPS